MITTIYSGNIIITAIMILIMITMIITRMITMIITMMITMIIAMIIMIIMMIIIIIQYTQKETILVQEFHPPLDDSSTGRDELSF